MIEEPFKWDYTVQPTEQPTEQPSEQPSEQPTEQPSEQPSEQSSEPAVRRVEGNHLFFYQPAARAGWAAMVARRRKAQQFIRGYASELVARATGPGPASGFLADSAWVLGLGPGPGHGPKFLKKR